MAAPSEYRFATFGSVKCRGVMSLAYRFVVVLTCSIFVAAAAAQPSSPTVLWEQPLRRCRHHPRTGKSASQVDCVGPRVCLCGRWK